MELTAHNFQRTGAHAAACLAGKDDPPGDRDPVDFMLPVGRLGDGHRLVREVARRARADAAEGRIAPLPLLNLATSWTGQAGPGPAARKRT